MLKIEEFKIRCSAIGQIMVGTTGLTDIQETTLNSLINKQKALTDIQETTLSDLITKRDNPELPAGAKKYCKNWLIGQIYGKTQSFTSKYTSKGIECEAESIEFVNEKLGLFAEKNELKFVNEFMAGTPDVVLENKIIDIKNSWNCFTFPLFETDPEKQSYIDQLQGYMYLTGRKKAMLIYTLMDAPEFIIEQEAWKLCRASGESELTAEFFDIVKNEMTYSNIEDVKLRMQIYEFEIDLKRINEIIDRVQLCRKYINTLLQ